MAALSANRNTRTKGVGRRQSYQVKASTTIYKGGLVAVDSSGYAVPAGDTAGHRVVGLALEKIDNSSGASGDKSVEVLSDVVVLLVGSGITIANLDELATVSDDQTGALAAATTNDIPLGTIVEVESANVIWFYIPPYGLKAA